MVDSRFSYLLDTNILAELARNPQGRVHAKLKRFGAETVCTSVIATGEIAYGLH
jgi:tRNA(fMet)-specific endonuclease VapC